jgi:hypothetical protein
MCDVPQLSDISHVAMVVRRRGNENTRRVHHEDHIF